MVPMRTIGRSLLNDGVNIKALQEGIVAKFVCHVDQHLLGG
jgi:hypothetical protein